jgi:hypothetical protein
MDYLSHGLSGHGQDGLALDLKYECVQCGCEFDPATTNYSLVDGGAKVVCSDDCKAEYEMAHAIEELTVTAEHLIQTIEEVRPVLRSFVLNNPQPIEVVEPVDLDDVMDFQECEFC